MKQLDIAWYIINTGYENRLCIRSDDDSVTYMDYEEQCEFIEELDFPTGEYIILCNLNHQALRVSINYMANDRKNYNFDLVEISDLGHAIMEYLHNNYEDETGLVLLRGYNSIPNNLPYCRTFGVDSTQLYETDSGHHLLKLDYDSESG